MWMVLPVYGSTAQIDLKNGPSHQSGEEQGNLGGAVEIFCELFQHTIKWKIKKEQLWDIDDTFFVKKKTHSR